MIETIKFIFTHFHDETILVTSLFLLLNLAIFVSYWFYNKKRFQQLTHQIPASVVKNYLDTIIQNSAALQSSLMRGGNGDIASVMALGKLGGGGAGLEVSSELLNQKNAELTSLQVSLNEKQKIIRDLEAKVSDLAKSGGSASGEELDRLNGKIRELEAEIERLKRELAEAQNAASAGGDSAAQVTELSKERDELKSKLQEYEVIEDDLANLKKLQVENEALKKQLEQLVSGGAIAAAIPEPEPSPEPDPTPEPELAAEAEAEAVPVAFTEAPAATEEVLAEVPQALEGEEKSAEDLLSEFEKMLG